MPKKTSAEKLKKLVTKRNKTVQRIKKLKTKKTVPLRKVRTKIQEAKYKKTQKKINANPTAQANRKNAKPELPSASSGVRKKMKERMNKEMTERTNKERENRKLERMKPTRMGATRNATSRRTIRRTR